MNLKSLCCLFAVPEPDGNERMYFNTRKERQKTMIFVMVTGILMGLFASKFTEIERNILFFVFLAAILVPLLIISVIVRITKSKTQPCGPVSPAYLEKMIRESSQKMYLGYMGAGISFASLVLFWLWIKYHGCAGFPDFVCQYYEYMVFGGMFMVLLSVTFSLIEIMQKKEDIMKNM